MSRITIITKDSYFINKKTTVLAKRFVYFHDLLELFPNITETQIDFTLQEWTLLMSFVGELKTPTKVIDWIALAKAANYFNLSAKYSEYLLGECLSFIVEKGLRRGFPIDCNLNGVIEVLGHYI